MKMLIAEDDGPSRRLLEVTLTRWGYDVESVSNGADASAALLAPGGPRLAILDWMMPGLDGVSVCRNVREAGIVPYRYLILLTSQSGEDDLVAGLEAGADDYIAKPFKPAELKARLRAGRRILALQDELVTERNLFQSRAERDPLTRLWNHAEIFRILDRELARAAREGQTVAVIIGDLDRFKAINDTFGHLAGDTVVRAVAETMTSLLRPYDGVGRYGGDEFLVVLPGVDPEQAVVLAERLRSAIAAQPVDTSEGLVPVAMSLGVAACGCGAANTAEALVRAADAALYRAKRTGANRVVSAAGPAGDQAGLAASA
jgi:diguanylate cyclase (GGDEF)-like protein